MWSRFHDRWYHAFILFLVFWTGILTPDCVRCAHGLNGILCWDQRPSTLVWYNMHSCHKMRALIFDLCHKYNTCIHHVTMTLHAQSWEKITTVKWDFTVLVFREPYRPNVVGILHWWNHVSSMRVGRQGECVCICRTQGDCLFDVLAHCYWVQHIFFQFKWVVCTLGIVAPSDAVWIVQKLSVSRFGRGSMGTGI